MKWNKWNKENDLIWSLESIDYSNKNLKIPESGVKIFLIDLLNNNIVNDLFIIYANDYLENRIASLLYNQKLNIISKSIDEGKKFVDNFLNDETNYLSRYKRRLLKK